MKKELLIVAALTWSGTNAFAQQQADSTKQVQLDAVVVSTTRAVKDAPIAHSNLSEKEIKKSNAASNIPFVLQTLPSVVAYSEGGTAVGNTSYRIRGTDSNRINVTLNGMPVNNPESQDVFWVNIPNLSNSLQSMQIQRGVGTASNGVASFGASISMQTVGGHDKPYGEASTAIGSYNTFASSVAAGTGIMSNGLSIDGRYSQSASDGYIRNGMVDHKSGYISLSYYTDNQLIKALYIRGIQHTGITWEGISPKQMEQDRRHNVTGIYNDDAGNERYYDNDTDNYYSDIVQLIHSLRLGNSLTLNTNLSLNHGLGYYENYKADYELSKFGLSPQVIGGKTYSKTDVIRRKLLSNDLYSGSVSVNYAKDKLTIAGGAMYNYFDGNHYGRLPWVKWNENIETDHQWYYNDATKRDMNVFAKLEYRPNDALSLFAEIQNRYVDYRMEGTDDDLADITQNSYYNFVNPKIGASYRFSAANEAYASFGVSNREPLRADAKEHFKKGNEVDPERLFDYEAGYRYSDSRFSFEANLYYMKYKDQLVQTGKLSTSGYKLQENVKDSYRMGIELSAAYTPTEWLRVDANTTISRNKIKNYMAYYSVYDNDVDWNWVEDKEEFFGSTDISFSPNVVGSGIITITPIRSVRDLSFTFANKYVGAMYYNNQSDKENRLDGYFIANFVTQYTFKYQNKGSIDLRLFVNNYLNNKYVANAWVDSSKFQDGTWLKGLFPQAPCNIMAQVGIRF